MNFNQLRFEQIKTFIKEGRCMGIPCIVCFVKEECKSKVGGRTDVSLFDFGKAIKERYSLFYMLELLRKEL